MHSITLKYLKRYQKNKVV